MSRLKFTVITAIVILFSLFFICSCSDIIGLSSHPEPPGKAVNPQPADDSDNIPLSPILTWKPVKDACLYRVYLGTDISSLELIGTVAVPRYSIIEDLDWPVTYYWRIDSINSTGITKSDIWRFTTFPVTSSHNASCSSGVMPPSPY